MPSSGQSKGRVYLDLTHLGRHVTGIERVSIEQFERTEFAGADIVPVRSKGVASMILRQQFLLPLLALLHPSAQFAFPGFPPSPVFALIPRRVVMYVHDTFLLTRRHDLSRKAQVYMAPQFKWAVERLNRFLVNSEKTRTDLKQYTRPDAQIELYRPSADNPFKLDTRGRTERTQRPAPLKLVSVGTIEPRKNYSASVAILEHIRASFDPSAELHVIGRTGWGGEGQTIANRPGVIVHGYLPASDVKAVLEGADVYLCTSHDEGLGLPLLEAQFAGLAVVAPDQAVFREVLGKSGTYINPADPDGAARAIAQLTGTIDWRTTTATAAACNVQRWNELAASDLAAAKAVFYPASLTDRRTDRAAAITL